MMKRSLFVAIAALGLGGTALGNLMPGSSVRADLVPTKLTFNKFKSNDVAPGGPDAIRVGIAVKNIGTHTVKGTLGKVAVVIGSRIVYAYQYGPGSRGGVFGDFIKPGETGLLSVVLELGALSHCQQTRVQIDRQRTLQDGDLPVFQNDTATLVAIDPSSIRVCLFPPVVKP